MKGGEIPFPHEPTGNVRGKVGTQKLDLLYFQSAPVRRKTNTIDDRSTEQHIKTPYHISSY